MLHLVFQSPIESAVLERITSGDIVVFLESAVFCVLKTGVTADILSKSLKNIQIFVMTDDIAIRGIQQAELIPGIKVIGYSDLVKLTIENPLNTSWC